MVYFASVGHQVALLALIANLVTRWRYLYQLQIGPPDGATCISCKLGGATSIGSKVGHHVGYGDTCISDKFGHQVASLALPWIVLLALSVGIELVSSSARVTSIKSTKALALGENRTHR